MKELKDIETPRMWRADNPKEADMAVFVVKVADSCNGLNAAVRELREAHTHWCEEFTELRTDTKQRLVQLEQTVQPSVKSGDRLERRYSVEDLREKLRTSYPSPSWRAARITAAEYGRLYDFLTWLEKEEGEK